MRVFVSYQHRDSAWAEWMSWQLEELGHDVALQAWDFVAGANFVLEMQRALTSADKVVAVLSQNFLQSDFAAPEWAAAFARDPTGTSRRLVPVRVGPCRPSGLLGQLVYTDLVGLSEPQAVKALSAAIEGRRRKPLTAPAFPDQTGHLSAEGEGSPTVDEEIEDAAWYLSDLPPRSPSLGQLIGIPSSMDEVEERWASHTVGPISADIGIMRTGELVNIDLTVDGPCGFIVGTSGSGTSELLRTLICSLSTSYSPNRVRFQLLDQKGGGVWHAIRDFPHVANVLVEDAPGGLDDEFFRFARALTSQKERAMAEGGSHDIGDFNTKHPGEPLPVDVVLVDELFGDERLAAALTWLQRIGRSLGIAVIAASAGPRFLPKDYALLARFGIFMGHYQLEEIRELAVFGDYRSQLPVETGSRPAIGRAILARGSGLSYFQAGWTGGWAPGVGDSLYTHSRELEQLGDLLRMAARRNIA